MAFQKGSSGNPGGRPRGTSNKATAEIRELAQRLFDKDYWIQTRELIRQNQLHPAIHARLLEIASKEQNGAGNGNGLTVNLGFMAITNQPEPRQLQSQPDIGADNITKLTTKLSPTRLVLPRVDDT